MSEKDDEITIDFGKITNFFKKKGKRTEKEIKKENEKIEKLKEREKKEEEKLEILKEEEKEVKKAETKIGKEEEELSIDFKKVKDFFKKKEKEIAKQGTEELEISLDYKKVLNFFKKYGVIFLILIPIVLSIYLRIQPAYLPATDDWARNSVYNSIQNSIAQQINQQYPNLPVQSRNELVENQFNVFIKEQKGAIEDQIKRTAEYFKSKFQDNNGQTYLVAIDPYQYLRYTENYLENGHPGDEIVDGKPRDYHMVAPLGSGASLNFHIFFSALLYKFWSISNPSLTVLKSNFYVPLIISALSVIPAFFIGRKVGGNIGGLFAAIIVAIHPHFVTRTIAGFSDTDAYNVLFPLLVVWFFLEAFDAKNMKNKISLSCLSGFFIGVFAFAWDGWWYIFDFIIAAGGIMFLYYLVLYKNKILRNIKEINNLPHFKTFLIVIICFLISSAFFISIIGGPSQILHSITDPIGRLQIKFATKADLWPNVFTTVAELNPASLTEIVGAIGGKFLLLISIFGIIATMLVKKEGHIDIKYASLLTIWFVGTIFMATKGVRFVLLLVPAFGIAFGIAIGFIYQNLTKWISKNLDIGKIVIKVVIILVAFLLVGFSPIPSCNENGCTFWNYGIARAAKNTAVNEVPSISNEWVESLQLIKEKSEQNAIINSWWDFGHWFKYWADRAVTFDGASQNTPQAHWIGKVLLTDDEKLAIGILRMLDCGANSAFDFLYENVSLTQNKSFKSIQLINQIIVLDKNKAEKVLEDYGLKENEIEILLKYTHCEPPEDYFITSEDMVGKSGVWAHFGGWDFEKAKIWINLKKINDEGEGVAYLIKEFNYSEDKARQIYYDVKALREGSEANTWISPWPSYITGFSDCQDIGNETIRCINRLSGNQAIVSEIDLEKNEAVIKTQQGDVLPYSFVYPLNNELIEKRYKNSTFAYSVDIKNTTSGYQSMIVLPELARSTFTKLFYYGGLGTKHFDLFSDKTTVNGQRIIVWKVDWEGKKEEVIKTSKKSS